MKFMVLLMLLVAIAATPSTSRAVSSDEVFNSDTYNWAVSNDEIIKAARCEVTDEFIYGKQRFDYQTNVFVIGLMSGRDSHQCLEHGLAFGCICNYYRGIYTTLKKLDPQSDKALRDLTRTLDCKAFNAKY